MRVSLSQILFSLFIKLSNSVKERLLILLPAYKFGTDIVSYEKNRLNMVLFVYLFVCLFFLHSVSKRSLFSYVTLTDVSTLAGLGNSHFQDLKSCFHVST